MYAAGVAVMCVFAVYGIITFVHSICEKLLRKGICDRVLIYVKSSAKNTEGVVRSLMLKNPGAEIIVVDEGDSIELRKILDHLCQDYARVHIARLEP